jgi:hypothetical protein
LPFQNNYKGDKKSNQYLLQHRSKNLIEVTISEEGMPCSQTYDLTYLIVK